MTQVLGLIWNRNSLSNIDKFDFLRGQLKSDGREAISRHESTDANYWIVTETLQEQYGKKQLIINPHYEKIKKIKTKWK